MKIVLFLKCDLTVCHAQCLFRVVQRCPLPQLQLLLQEKHTTCISVTRPISWTQKMHPAVAELRLAIMLSLNRSFRLKNRFYLHQVKIGSIMNDNRFHICQASKDTFETKRSLEVGDLLDFLRVSNPTVPIC